jgi:hypothetical protein
LEAKRQAEEEKLARKRAEAELEAKRQVEEEELARKRSEAELQAKRQVEEAELARKRADGEPHAAQREAEEEVLMRKQKEAAQRAEAEPNVAQREAEEEELMRKQKGAAQQARRLAQEEELEEVQEEIEIEEESETHFDQPGVESYHPQASSQHVQLPGLTLAAAVEVPHASTPEEETSESEARRFHPTGRTVPLRWSWEVILDIVEALDFPSNSADDSSVLPVFHRSPFSVIWEAPPATLTSQNHGFRIMSWSIASCFRLLLDIDSIKHEGERKNI